VPQPPAPDDSVDPVDLVGEPVVVAPPVEATPVVHAPPAEPELPPFLAALEPGPPAALERAAWPPSADGRAHRYGRDSVSATRRRRAPLRAERNGQGERTDRS
jgi:hypothetical protein